MSTVNRQHFVPQFYLRRFSVNGERKQVYTFDKTTRTQSVEAIKKVAQLHRFYDARKIDSTVGQPQFLEKMFSRLEDRAAPLLAKIVESATTRVPPDFSDDDLGEITAFVAFQFLRTQESRLRITQAWRLTTAELIGTHGPSVVTEFPPTGPEDESQLHGESLQSRDLLMRIGASLVRRFWAVRTILVDGPQFLTSDNPVVYAPVIRRPGPYGIESPDVAVVLPLSPKVLLTFLPQASGDPFEFELFGIEAAEVAAFNRMQVASATSHLFSSKPDFDLALAMLDEHPIIGDPRRPRWRVGGGRSAGQDSES